MKSKSNEDTTINLYEQFAEPDPQEGITELNEAEKEIITAIADNMDPITLFTKIERPYRAGHISAGTHRFFLNICLARAVLRAKEEEKAKN